MNSERKNYKTRILTGLLILVFGILIGFYIQNKGNADQTQFNETNLPQIELRKSTIYIPGVDNNGRGVSAILETTVRDGSGFVLVNINDVTAGSTTQESARLAFRATKKYLNLSSEQNNFDVIYDIKTDASSVDGPSAGAAMAISLVSLLENKTLNEKVSITGFVDEEGFIGPVSGIEEKALAMKEKGAEIMLVSDQIALSQEYIRTKSCMSENERIYCEVTYVAGGELDISGIKIIQVKDMEGAHEYFYKE